MKYDTRYVEFFSLFYLLFGASALNVLRGPGHFGSVVSQTNWKSCYSGENAMCNIPIPDVTILRKFDSGFEKVTPTGIIEKTLEKCSQQKDREFVVTFDGMHVAQGSKNKSDGDVDLWGAEGNPSIKLSAQKTRK